MELQLNTFGTGGDVLVVHATQVDAIREASNGELNLVNGFTYCRLCGDLFIHNNEYNRRIWSFDHSETHHPVEHIALERSGNWLTPEAAIRLAPYGVIPLGDMVVNAAVAQAMLEAPRMPAV